MLPEFKEHLINNFPDLVGSPFLLACSGGIDSVVLTHLCHSLKLDFELAHCNFHLRGEESNEDEKFVLALAGQLDKKVNLKQFDPVSDMQELKGSVQMVARQLRYTWFRDLMKDNGIGTLVTAHHADDALETFLINLSRGTGLDGLLGMPENLEGVARPLLRFSRNEIEGYAIAQGFSWREDSTNRESKYLRNRIRHEIVPKLKELHPVFLLNFVKTCDHLKGSSEVLGVHIAKLKSRLFTTKKGHIEIDVIALQKLHPLNPYVYALFREYGFREWEDVALLLKAMSGKEIVSGSHRLIKDRGKLLLLELRAEEQKVYAFSFTNLPSELPLGLKVEEVVRMEQTSPCILYADKETLNKEMVVRKWKKGDYFYPLGMHGKKKVSKYFKDEKFDKISKEDQWILCSGGEIVWIIGHRADKRFRVRNDTRHILKVTLHE